MLASDCFEVDAPNELMKIVHVETGRHFYGGPQQVIWLISGLMAEGVENLLVCPPDSAVDTAARDAGIAVSNLPCSGDHDIRFAWQLRCLLRREKPDLVHCHSRRGADFLGGIAARIAGIPAVLSRRVDNSESSFMASMRYRWFKSIVAISQNISSMLIENGLDKDRLSVIRDTVDVDSVNPEPDRDFLRTEFDIPNNAIAIAVVAQLIPRKGHRFLLDVLPGLLVDHIGIKVVFFGAGPGESDLRSITRKLGLVAAVRFAGFREDLDRYLGAFDLLVHPAEKEGLGVAMLKGAAAGLPVIAFDVAGSKEAVEHGKTGILVEPDDLDGLQRAIEVMVEEEEIRKELGNNGRQRMQDEFSVKVMVNAHVELYKQLMNE